MALARRGNSGISINRHHPAAHQIQLLAVTANGGQMVDVAHGVKGTSNGSASTSQDAILGRATNLNTATTTDVEFAALKSVSYTNSTVAALVKVTALPGAASRLISDNVPGTSGLTLGLNASNKFIITAGSTAEITAANAVVAGGIYFVAASMHIGTVGTPDVLMYRRLDATAFEALTATVNPGTLTNGATITLGQKSSTAYWHGDIAWALLSYRFVSLEQLIKWSSDPWSIFFRGQSIYYAFSQPVVAASKATTLALMGVG